MPDEQATLAPQLARCRSCHAPIYWALTERGKRIPLDAVANPKGNMLLEPANETRTVWRTRAFSPLFDGLQRLYMPHHATCPQGKEWKR
jgi:hypothetical protein